MQRRSAGSSDHSSMPNEPQRNSRTGAIYTGSSSTGVATYAYPGDPDYQSQLERQQKQLADENERANRREEENVPRDNELSIV
jgi:hypothetical protein